MSIETQHIHFLVERFKSGEKEAFRELYELFAPKVKSLCLRLSITSDESNDIVQDVFVQVWMHRQDIDPNQSFVGYIFMIAKNMIYNKVRHQQYIRQYEQQSEPEYHQPEIEKRMDLRKIMLRAIDDLPEACKQIYKMSRMEGNTNSAIAEKLNISKSTVENQINKALKRIKQVLEEHGYKLKWLIVFWLVTHF